LSLQRGGDALVYNFAVVSDARWSDNVVLHVDLKLTFFDQQ
jgi:hypothetical protein